MSFGIFQTSTHLSKLTYLTSRLLYEVERMLSGKAPIVFIPVRLRPMACLWSDRLFSRLQEGSEEFSDLQYIKKREEVHQLGIVERAEAWVAKIRAKKPWPLPEKPNSQAMSDWLIECRMKALKGTISVIDEPK